MGMQWRFAELSSSCNMCSPCSCIIFLSFENSMCQIFLLSPTKKVSEVEVVPKSEWNFDDGLRRYSSRDLKKHIGRRSVEDETSSQIAMHCPRDSRLKILFFDDAFSTVSCRGHDMRTVRSYVKSWGFRCG